MRKIVPLLILLLFFVGIASYFWFFRGSSEILSPYGQGISRILEKPLEKYTYGYLKAKSFKESKIEIGKIIKEGDGFNSRMFYFYDGGRRVSGVMNLPDIKGEFPVIVMFRGYVDREKYTPGEGTRHSGEVFAKEGFITLAPDFLGYGESENPSDNSIEERFQTYTTALTLFVSLKNLNGALDSTGAGQTQAIISQVGVWGHSNGGQIALSVMEISGRKYPTVLWNPVSKPFPYSVLYFTDEFDDHGKALRRVIADFEKDYDIEKYSLTNYFGWIEGSIQLHQAVEDEAVPVRWSDQLYEELKKLEKDVNYFTYPGEDHNFSKGSWNTAVSRSINFYNQQFQE